MQGYNAKCRIPEGLKFCEPKPTKNDQQNYVLITLW